MIEYLRLFLENCFKFVAFIRTNDMEFENQQHGKPTSESKATNAGTGRGGCREAVHRS